MSSKIKLNRPSTNPHAKTFYCSVFGLGRVGGLILNSQLLLFRALSYITIYNIKPQIQEGCCHDKPSNTGWFRESLRYTYDLSYIQEASISKPQTFTRHHIYIYIERENASKTQAKEKLLGPAANLVNVQIWISYLVWNKKRHKLATTKYVETTTDSTCTIIRNLENQSETAFHSIPYCHSLGPLQSNRAATKPTTSSLAGLV